MSSLRVRLIFYTACVMVLAITSRLNHPAQTTPIAVVQTDPQASTFPVAHYRFEDVNQGISLYPPLQIGATAPLVRGGVVAHHLLVQKHIAKYFQNLSQSAYRRVVLLGPNHGELGSAHVITSDHAWETPYGLVMASQSSVAQLKTCATTDPIPLKNDHALEVLMPFIKVYLPTAEVVPLLISGHLTQSELAGLVACLIPLLSPDTLVLVSSDFSHYLSSTNAAKKDLETLSLLKSWDLKKILTLTSDNLDSPPSLVVLMELMGVVNAKKLQVFDHTDASVIVHSPHQATTTHYFLNYYVK